MRVTRDPTRRERILRSMSALSAMCGWSLVFSPLLVRSPVCGLDGAQGLSSYCEASYASVEPWTGLVVVLIATVMQFALRSDTRDLQWMVLCGVIGGIAVVMLSAVSLAMPWGVAVVVLVASLAVIVAIRHRVA